VISTDGARDRVGAAPRLHLLLGCIGHRSTVI
jgi:hypothetical protein